MAVTADNNVKFNRLIRKTRLLTRPAALDSVLGRVFQQHKDRIFVRGKTAQGNRLIGRYDTKKISIATKNQAGSTGRTLFPGGYKEYKSAIGKDSSKVNLDNFGDLKNSYKMTKLGKNTVFSFDSPEEAQKSFWMERKYNAKIFNLSQAELRKFRKEINIAIRLLFSLQTT